MDSPQAKTEGVKTQLFRINRNLCAKEEDRRNSLSHGKAVPALSSEGASGRTPAQERRKAFLLPSSSFCNRTARFFISACMKPLWADRRTCFVRRVCGARKVVEAKSVLLRYSLKRIPSAHSLASPLQNTTASLGCVLAALLHRSAGKVFFCQAFLFAKKRLRSKYSVKQFFTLSGQTGGLVSSGVSAVRGSAPDVSFAKLFFLQRKAGYLTISLAAAAYLAIFASTSSLFAPFAMI